MGDLGLLLCEEALLPVPIKCIDCSPTLVRLQHVGIVIGCRELMSIDTIELYLVMRRTSIAIIDRALHSEETLDFRIGEKCILADNLTQFPTAS